MLRCSPSSERESCTSSRSEGDNVLLTISSAAQPATDLGFLLHKHPARVQEVELSFGKAHVFYPEASAERCTAALLLEVDPVGLVRGRGDGERPRVRIAHQ